jgi:hypothetical protein
MVKGIPHNCVFFTSTLVGFTTKGHKVGFFSTLSSPMCCDSLTEEHESYTLHALSNHCRAELEPYLSVMAPPVMDLYPSTNELWSFLCMHHALRFSSISRNGSALPVLDTRQNLVSSLNIGREDQPSMLVLQLGYG